jgi:phospholipase C
MTMRRRDALKTIGGLAGAATMSKLLPACGDNLVKGPGEITTIVAMMMENRSFNHFFGSRTLLEGKNENGLPAGVTNPDLAGKMIASWMTSDSNMLCGYDPPHSWDRARQQFNDGKLDGFVVAHQQANNNTSIDPMQFLVRNQVPTSYALADAYTMCNRWFASVLGPTYPNRYYWHSGQAHGHMDNTFPSEVWPTLYDRLNAAGIDWAYYYGDFAALSILGPSADGHMFRFKDFAAAAKAGTLPPVVYIDPGFSLNDDHPPHHPSAGQQLIGAVYAALAQSPQWKNLLFVITYDEHGGYYDHVVPPKAPDALEPFQQFGFRVPAMVIGPYAKEAHVSSVQYDHTSVLKHIETMFNLEPLTMRDAAATDLSDCIDQVALAEGNWRKPVDVPMVTIDEFSLPAMCLEGTIPSRGGSTPLFHHDILAMADAHPERFGRYDHRDELRSYLETIHEMLAPHGGGVRWGR